VKKYLNNTPNAKEGTDGQKCRRLKRIAMWAFEIWSGETVFTVNLVCL